MTLVKVAAGLLAAGTVAGAHAAATFSEGFDSVAGLGAAGWVFTNASAPAGLSWFQGNGGIFVAESGAADAYAGVNFNSTTTAQGVVDNWLISPEVAFDAGSTLTFFTRASDTGFFDLLEVRFSSGAGAAVAGFSTLLGMVGSTATPAYPVADWVAFTMALPTVASGRFAFRYSVANALDASFVGIDSVSITPVPEPGTMVLFGLGGLAAAGIARRRKAGPAQPASL